MRIDEIIQSKEKISQIPTNWNLDLLKKRQTDAISSRSPSIGYYSRGFATNDPFMYGKKSHMPSDLINDGYYQYVKALKPIMDSNPYAPRVYLINLQKDQQGYIRPIYQIEKLVHGQTLSKKVIYAMGVKTFGSEQWVEEFAVRSSLRTMDNIDLWKALCKGIELVIYAWPGRLFTQLPIDIDPALKEMAKLIKMTNIKNSNLEIVLHFNNIMVRPGPVPHVVISDPLDG